MGTNQSLPKVTPQDRAILDLKLQRDKLKQYQKKIQGVLDREEAIAKEQLAQGKKEKALIALRRRKYQQSLLSKTDDQLFNLEQLVSTIEFSMVEVSVVHGLKQGNEVLKQIHKEMSLETVEKLVEETAEAREYQREISDMLANTLTVDEEEDVQRELLALQEEIASLSVTGISLNLNSDNSQISAEETPLRDADFPQVPDTTPDQVPTVKVPEHGAERERVLVPG